MDRKDGDDNDDSGGELMRTKAGLKGLKTFYDEHGEPAVILIDLKKNPELWENFCDLMLSEKRQGKRSYSSAEVKEYLRKHGKLS